MIDRKLYKGEWIMGELKLNEFECIDYESGVIESMKKPVDQLNMTMMKDNELVDLLSNDDLKTMITQLVIGEGCGNGLYNDLKLCMFENLDSLIIEKDSLRNLNILMIYDNPVLNRIVAHSQSCKMVKSVTMTSTLIDY